MKIHKLLARKRPRLFPIYDSFIGAQLNATSINFTRNLRPVLRYGNGEFSEHLRNIRTEVNEAEDLSLIRVFDIVVWRAEEQRRR